MKSAKFQEFLISNGIVGYLLRVLNEERTMNKQNQTIMVEEIHVSCAISFSEEICRVHKHQRCSNFRSAFCRSYALCAWETA